MSNFETCCWCSREPNLHCHQSWGYHIDWKQIEKDINLNKGVYKNESN